MIDYNTELKKLCEKYSVNEVADWLGVSRQQISNWLKNLSTPNLSNYEKICKLIEAKKGES